MQHYMIIGLLIMVAAHGTNRTWPTPILAVMWLLFWPVPLVIGIWNNVKTPKGTAATEPDRTGRH